MLGIESLCRTMYLLRHNAYVHLMIQYTSHTPSNRGVFAVFELTVHHFTVYGQPLKPVRPCSPLKSSM